MLFSEGTANAQELLLGASVATGAEGAGGGADGGTVGRGALEGAAEGATLAEGAGFLAAAEAKGTDAETQRKCALNLNDK